MTYSKTLLYIDNRQDVLLRFRKFHMSIEKETSKNVSWQIIGFLFACYFVPFLFLRFHSAWINTLTGKETVPLIFFLLTLVFLGFGYRKLYLIPGGYKEGQPYSSVEFKQKHRMFFWIGSGLVLLMFLVLI